MANPLPTIIAGPAIVSWNGHKYYSKAGVKAAFKRETFKVMADTEGAFDERMKSQMTEVTFQPVGMVSDLTGYFPYGISTVGKSVFTTSNLPLVIVTKFGGASNTGQTITYPRGACTKFPQLRLKPIDTLFGDMTFTCLGDPTVQPNAASTWETIADVVFADTTYDETAITTDIYSAAFGSAPFATMGSMNGFEIDITMELETITADDFGIADMHLKSLAAGAKFAPSNLTQANISTLLANQTTGYVFPGQSLSKSNTDLVIVGSGNLGAGHTLTFTLKNAGPKQAGYIYGLGKHRLDVVEFTSKRTWTTGVANALWTLAAA